MNHFMKYLAHYSKELNLKFEGIRESYTDSDVKGGKNEEALKKFFIEHYPAWSVRLGCQIIGFNDKISDEIDISVCNKDQAFAGEESSLLVAEGVDFVVQSKAILSDSELDRSIKNCISLRSVKRAVNKGDMVYIPEGVQSINVPHIPYLIFAFSSELNEKSVLERINSKLKNIPIELQPDALYILDRGKTLINLRDGSSGFITKNDKSVEGWILVDTGDQTLSEMLRFVNNQLPIFHKVNSPLKSYFHFDSENIVGYSNES